MEPAEMAALVSETERAWQALGGIQYGPTEAEKSSLRFRRSIYIAQDVKAGEVLTRENLRVVRPGHGLAPKYYEMLLGRRVKRDLAMGAPMDWSYLG
jgi:N-acetylneuraminate synthase